MCAINGFNFKDENLILKMNQVTRHRGPDGTGVFLNDGVSFGHNRLSIIDLSDAASQPMRSFDGKQIIIFNGEIYNFSDLKEELKNDYSFTTQSDTEMILAAYRTWGSECVKRFNGIFAFAIWDTEKKELFLARDHMGVKPLYYFHEGGKFIFSSEVKAILQHSIPRKLNIEAFNHYMRVLYVPAPLTMFKGIYKFPAGHFGIVRGKRFELHKFWNGKAEIQTPQDFSELQKDLRDKVERAVERQLISDRPLGIYLSGGIDSSVVLDCVSRVRSNIDTFSVGFDLLPGEQKEKFNKDFELARRTASHYGTRHHEVLLFARDVNDMFEKAVWHMDEPISNPTTLAMMKLASFAKQTAAVVLGGDGGDELFGGYDRYRYSVMSRYYQKLPNAIRQVASRSRRLQKLDTPEGVDQFMLFMFQKDNIIARVLNGEFFNPLLSKDFFERNYFSPKANPPLADGMQSFEQVLMDTDRKTWLVDYSLMLTDKMSMSSGLEARVPLLDKDLVEFASHIPSRDKVDPFRTKILFKRAFRGRIPEFLFREPKRGWFSPASKWLRYPEVDAMAQEVLSANFHEGTASLFKWDGVRDMLIKHKAAEEYNLTMIWALLTFQMWARQYRITI